VVRRLIADAVEAEPGSRVAGTAANGRIALTKIAQLKPDAITLDIEMPELDGLGTLRELRRTNRTVPVIMFSTLSVAGATATLEALAAGATDFVTKPSNVGSFAERLDRSSAVQVVEATDGVAVRPGVVYLAPGDYHLTLANRAGTTFTKLLQTPQENSCRPAADVMFRSVAEVYGGATVAVVL